MATRIPAEDLARHASSSRWPRADTVSSGSGAPASTSSSFHRVSVSGAPETCRFDSHHSQRTKPVSRAGNPGHSLAERQVQTAEQAEGPTRIRQKQHLNLYLWLGSFSLEHPTSHTRYLICTYPAVPGEEEAVDDDSRDDSSGNHHRAHNGQLWRD